MRWMTLCLLLPVVLAGVPAHARADDAAFFQARAYFERQIDRPPLTFRLGAMHRLARTQDPRALQILIKRYARPRVPKDHERYLLASVIGQHFTGPEHVDALWGFVRAYRKDEHAWLWLNALGAAARVPDAPHLGESARNRKLKPFLRAAALEALAAHEHPLALEIVRDLAGERLPRKGLARVVLLESCAVAILAFRDDVASTRVKPAALALIGLLGREDVADRTKLVIARHLAQVFRVNRIALDPAYWRRMLDFEAQPVHAGPTVVGRPRFFGIEAGGRRIAYVLDLSDSMLDRLTPRELEDARARQPRAQGGAELFDWKKVASRFDLARAYLKHSLLALDPKVSFVIVGFGDEARPFRATKGLVRASRGAVQAAVRELDAIEPGRRTPKRPYGTLRGTTNLHGAILRAFRARPKKLIDEHEHVDADALMDGCDTVFVFSDGRPTKDDFSANDQFGGGKLTTDAEKGETETRGAGSASYFGPYRQTGNLLTDLKRLNTFRKAEIHAVSMGEAAGILMRGLASAGLGRTTSVGMLGRGGRVNAWWVIGPFPAPDKASWSKAEAPEEGVHLGRAQRIGEKRVYWRRLYSTHRDAIIRLDGEFDPKDDVCAYAYAEIITKRAGPARLHLGSNDGIRIWLDGALVHSHLEPRRLRVDQDAVDVTLRAGVNRLLVKICDAKGPWSFCVRITDPRDKPLDFRME